MNEERIFEEKVGTKLSDMKNEKEEMECRNEEDMKIINDKDATPDEKDAARERVAWRNEEIRRITTGLRKSSETDLFQRE